MPEEKTPSVYYRVTDKGIQPVEGLIIGESRWIVYVNDRELVSLMATPVNLHHLVLGFLASENLIGGLAQIASVRVNLAPDLAYWFIPALGIEETRKMAVCEEGVGSILVRLSHESFSAPERRVVTSGCGGGVTFDDLTRGQAPLNSTLRIRPHQILNMMHELNTRAKLYRECRGVHTCALGDGEQLLALAEDVGRHNTVDKIRGECLMKSISTEGRVLLSTGRISSEMVAKAAKMQVPIVVSRTSPTDLAVQLAKTWNMTLVGYAQGGQMLVYAGLERIDATPSDGRMEPERNLDSE